MTTESSNLDFLKTPSEEFKKDLFDRIHAAESFLSLMDENGVSDFTADEQKVILAGFLKIISPKKDQPSYSDVDNNYLLSKIVDDIIVSTSKTLIENCLKRTCNIYIPKENEDLYPQLVRHWSNRGFKVILDIIPPVEKDFDAKTRYHHHNQVISFMVTLKW